MICGKTPHAGSIARVLGPSRNPTGNCAMKDRQVFRLARWFKDRLWPGIGLYVLASSCSRCYVEGNYEGQQKSRYGGTGQVTSHILLQIIRSTLNHSVPYISIPMLGWFITIVKDSHHA